MLQDVIDALRRNAPEALALARGEVAAAPESADANHLLGLAQRNAGDRDGARASFERAIELAPDESLYHFSRALLAHAENDVETLNRATAHAIALDPNQMGAYLLRIQIALASNDFAEAERQLVLADRVNRADPRLLLASGQIALAKGDGDRAIDMLSHAAQARPNDAQVAATLALAYQSKGNHAFAEQAARKAIALSPAASGMRRVLVEALLGQQRVAEADAELAIYRQQHPDDPAGLALDAERQLRAGDATAAVAGYRAALARQPRNLRALNGLETALGMLGDRSAARAAWEEVLQRDSGFDPVWASRLFMTDDIDDYNDVLRRWREALPDSPAALLNQARQDEVDGRDAEAEAGYDAVLARAPLQPDALFGKAMYALRSDPTAAIERLDVLVAHAPKALAKGAVAARGQVRDHLEQLPEAIADWQQAHVGLGSLPSPIALPTAALEALAGLPLPDASAATSVVMLWGPPGSGSERLAAALQFSPSRPILRDAPDLRPRLLDFPDSLIAGALDADTLPASADEVATVIGRSIAPYQRQGNLGVFDWLGRWDARVVPLLRRAVPGTRLVAALRDPRDLLLNWLAFGAPAGPAFGEPVASARWLASQLEHLLAARDVAGLPVLVVDMDAFDADAAAGMRAIAQFADLPTPPDAQVALQRRQGPGRQPTLLPAGRWRAYREPFAEAFAVLAPVAAALGYPRD